MIIRYGLVKIDYNWINTRAYYIYLETNEDDDFKNWLQAQEEYFIFVNMDEGRING
jgi:hypothetical protein